MLDDGIWDVPWDDGIRGEEVSGTADDVVGVAVVIGIVELLSTVFVTVSVPESTPPSPPHGIPS